MMVSDITQAGHVLNGRPAADERPCLVCISNTVWNESCPTNREQIMLRLSKHMRVLVVEAPESLLGRIVGHGHPPARPAGRGLREHAHNLWLLGPSDVIPYPLTRRFSRLADLNDWFVRLNVRWAVRRLGFRRPFLWIYAPDGGHYLKTLAERRSIYHCVDDYEAGRAYEYPGRRASFDREHAEEHLASHVDDIIVTSPHLEVKMRDLNPRTTLMTNVADVELFGQAVDPGFPATLESASWSRPVIGYVGALDSHKVDLALLDAVAAAHPEWTFVCIGPIGIGGRTEVHDMPRRPNILYIGERPQKELPSYVKAFDAAIIPYQLNDYTRGIFPLKFFEYLAAGKPVVSTPLPALRDYREIAYFADDATGFGQSLKQALAERDGVAALKRSRMAQQHSWNSRTNQILDLLSVN